TPLPKAPLLIFACFCDILGYIMTKQKKREEKEKELLEKKQELERVKKPEAVTSLLMVDPMELEVGYSLIPFIDPEQGGDFLDRITMIRRQSALEQGIVVPPIRIRDNIQLPKDTYVIKIRGTEVGRGSLKGEYFLAMGEGDITKIPGEEAKDPTFGLPCKWIKEENKELAEEEGFTVVDPASVMATHLTETIRKYATSLLGRQETKTLIDNIKEKYPSLVDELIPEPLSLGELQKVLHNLLSERVSIRDMVTILETLANWVNKTKEIGFLTEKVRQSLSRQITHQHQTADGRLLVITVNPALEEKIASVIQKTEEEERANLSPDEINNILKSLQGIMGKEAQQCVILTSPRVRRVFRNIIMPYLPFTSVLSYDEIDVGVKVTSIGMIG
ncbi:MAG: flagellar biosynthesis protein FlhA, partial [bacterium]